MHDLTGFQRDLLYTIAGLDKPHGLAIKDELENYYETEIHHGRLYPNLDTLVDKGLVEKGDKDRRTNFYTLTRRDGGRSKTGESGRTSTSRKPFQRDRLVVY
jgi:DNA-binding PadR family transcriptional regulator